MNRNPFLSKNWSIEGQQRLLKINPTLAATYKAEAKAERFATAEKKQAQAAAARTAALTGLNCPGYNPWLTQTWNRTHQMAITSKDPVEGRRLAEAAGKKFIPPDGY